MPSGSALLLDRAFVVNGVGAFGGASDPDRLVNRRLASGRFDQGIS